MLEEIWPAPAWWGQAAAEELAPAAEELAPAAEELGPAVDELAAAPVNDAPGSSLQVCEKKKRLRVHIRPWGPIVWAQMLADLN